MNRLKWWNRRHTLRIHVRQRAEPPECEWAIWVVRASQAKAEFEARRIAKFLRTEVRVIDSDTNEEIHRSTFPAAPAGDMKEGQIQGNFN